MISIPRILTKSMRRKPFSKPGSPTACWRPADFDRAGNASAGPGTVYVRQELDFLAPIKIGDTVTARVEVIEIMPEKKQLRLRTTCSNQDGLWSWTAKP